MYSRHKDSQVFAYHGSATTFKLPNGPLLRFRNYAETMSIWSICDGRATYIEFLTWLCTDSHVLAYAVLNAAHTAAVEGMAAKFGAMVLPGDCPRELFSPTFLAFDVADHDDFQPECA
jgi:hypothetical protein